MNVVAKNISAYNELELKGYIHSLVEKAKDRAQLLLVVAAVTDIYEEEVEDEATFWSRYTTEQRVELEKSFEESYDPSKWVSHEDVMKKYNKWLK